MENADNNSKMIQTLLAQVEDEPNNWGTRKKVALMLYQEERYLEAADTLWKAPEMPATDVDVAFSIKIISRARPNRSIRLVYELLRRNEGKPIKNKAMARALNMIGMPMMASRFYGAATSEDADLFDLSFEKQMLWFDDSGSLLDKWQESDQEAKPPLSVPLQDFAGDMIELGKLAEHAGENGEDRPDAAVTPADGPATPKLAPKVGAKAGNPTTPLVMPKPLAGVKPAGGAPVPPKPKLNLQSGAAVRKPDSKPDPKANNTTPMLLRPGGPKLPDINEEAKE